MEFLQNQNFKQTHTKKKATFLEAAAPAGVRGFWKEKQKTETLQVKMKSVVSENLILLLSTSSSTSHEWSVKRVVQKAWDWAYMHPK